MRGKHDTEAKVQDWELGDLGSSLCITGIILPCLTGDLGKAELMFCALRFLDSRHYNMCNILC